VQAGKEGLDALPDWCLPARLIWRCPGVWWRSVHASWPAHALTVSLSQVKSVTGNKILRLLKRNGLAPSLPEDLYHLIKKAVNVRKHLDHNRNDKDSKFRLILIESRIHRLARYYKRSRQLPPNWRYESATASALVA
jgi:ribosomal protein S15P/S13E